MTMHAPPPAPVSPPKEEVAIDRLIAQEVAALSGSEHQALSPDLKAELAAHRVLTNPALLTAITHRASEIGERTHWKIEAVVADAVPNGKLQLSAAEKKLKDDRSRPLSDLKLKPFVLEACMGIGLRDVGMLMDTRGRELLHAGYGLQPEHVKEIEERLQALGGYKLKEDPVS